MIDIVAIEKLWISTMSGFFGMGLGLVIGLFGRMGK
jgi:hypothetical protein|tara:strand:- start:271 stop:378 length:108 start_codon:yes stop_codon:yes gene_type:complete